VLIGCRLRFRLELIFAWSLAAPPLTTVGFDLRAAGRGRAEMIMASLAGREPQPAAQEHRKLVARASA
jgi:DNA-binding LacI/PurR family transcriptional regulator